VVMSDLGTIIEEDEKARAEALKLTR
jgi:hypothetical protein